MVLLNEQETDSADKDQVLVGLEDDINKFIARKINEGQLLESMHCAHDILEQASKDRIEGLMYSLRILASQCLHSINAPNLARQCDVLITHIERTDPSPFAFGRMRLFGDNDDFLDNFVPSAIDAPSDSNGGDKPKRLEDIAY